MSEPTDISIADATVKTAENLHGLLLKIAEHIRKIEAENLELRERIANGTK